LLLLIPQLRAIHFETQFYISQNTSKIRQDAAMSLASIDRGHSNVSNHVITSISTRLALTGFLHAPLQKFKWCELKSKYLIAQELSQLH
jgi:hypothetical protein